ncbi:MAG: hypothetical protein ACTHNW_16980 [Mucilaginibacter sp.]
MRIKNIFLGLLTVVLAGCAKNNKNFTLTSIQLNGYKHVNIPAQHLYLKVFNDQLAVPLTRTQLYPNDLPLPAIFNVSPTISMTLYKKSYHIQLWGDSTGYISSCRINMNSYKIIFPLSMTAKSDSLSVTINGSWQ